MGEALFWGLAASSSLLVGGAVALVHRVPARVLGLVLAFGAGVLISAVAFELVEEGISKTGDLRATALGLFAGSLGFYLGDAVIARWGGRHHRRRGDRRPGMLPGEPARAGPGLAILLGIILDGVPESIVIGLTVLEGNGVGAAFVVAVFLSNVPESFAATSQLRPAGWSRAAVLALWTLVMAASGLAAVAGYGLFVGASPSTVAAVLGFGGGAILAMLADSMMPQAFESGGRLAGLVTTLGFATAVAVDAWQQ
ncbi:MAG TPA: ZIP family zinc transporter [Micromonosporaceae bacterium]